jgi:hypothetical protein
LNGSSGRVLFGLGLAISSLEWVTPNHIRNAKQYSFGGYVSTDLRIVPEEKFSQVFVRQPAPTVNALANKLFHLFCHAFK